ncbi:Transcriptional activator NphR [Microbulbifer aggregans]|uniref:Transcriptional activator NphR n=1 Tax=Microbulbifer aggregans TaxID=1769779 RepID=A0A1C9W4K8_9GAMM|nr:AraC family transcriptional regulator [Microbulbifer aggregans]AOS96085.1 Transcriptional activator NphR [Microbulbifer aggregans]
MKTLSVNAALLGLVWRVIESYRIDPRTFIPASLYRPELELPVDAHISVEVYYGIIGKVLEEIDDEAVGIRSGSVMHPSHLHILGHAWMAIPTLLAGFQISENYCRLLIDDLDARFAGEGDRVGLIYQRSGDCSFKWIQMDSTLAGLVRLCRLQYGESFVPASVSMSRPAPVDRSVWDDYFGVDVQFDAPCDAVYIRRELAEQRLPTAHSGILERHDALLARAMASRHEADIVTKVRLEIQRQLPTGVLALEKIAEAVDCPTRTLHRKLTQNGTTFRQLLKETRIDLAQQYLREDSPSVTEIAFMLGYSDAGAFTRAFREWFGEAPSTYRARCK